MWCIVLEPIDAVVDFGRFGLGFGRSTRPHAILDDFAKAASLRVQSTSNEFCRRFQEARIRLGREDYLSQPEVALTQANKVK